MVCLLPQGFLNTDAGRAQEFFDKSAECFKKALTEVSLHGV